MGLEPEMAHWLYTKVIVVSITYASLVWVFSGSLRYATRTLNKVQRIAFLGIARARSSMLTETMETIFGLPPLYLMLWTEATLGPAV